MNCGAPATSAGASSQGWRLARAVGRLQPPSAAVSDRLRGPSGARPAAAGALSLPSTRGAASLAGALGASASRWTQWRLSRTTPLSARQPQAVYGAAEGIPPTPEQRGPRQGGGHWDGASAAGHEGDAVRGSGRYGPSRTYEPGHREHGRRPYAPAESFYAGEGDSGEYRGDNASSRGGGRGSGSERGRGRGGRGRGRGRGRVSFASEGANQYTYDRTGRSRGGGTHTESYDSSHDGSSGRTDDWSNGGGHGAGDDDGRRGRGGDGGGDDRSWQRRQQRLAVPGQMSYSRRVALLRKPALTAADKTELPPEERLRIFRALRTPLHGGRGSRPGGPAYPSSSYPSSRDRDRPPPSAASSSRPPLLRVFCYGIDDVRLYRALQGAGALGRVLVAPSVAEADAVLAVRIKRTGRAVSLEEVSNSARNQGKRLIELPTISAARVMEAVEALTGWPVPAHLRAAPPRPGDISYLPPLQGDVAGGAEALALLSGGLSLPQYLVAREAGMEPAPELVAELDRTDVYDSREALKPANPQEREARRQRPLTRPHMSGSRMERVRLREDQRRRRAEAEGEVPW